MRFVRFLVVALSIMLLAMTLTGCGSKETQQESARFTDGQTQIAETPGRKFDGSPAAGSGVTPTSVGDDAHSVWVDVKIKANNAWTWTAKVASGSYRWLLNLVPMALIIAGIRRVDPSTEGWIEMGIMLVLGLLGWGIFDLPLWPMILGALVEGVLIYFGGGKLPWWIKFPAVFGLALAILKYTTW